MHYRTIRLRNWISALFPWLVTLLERLRIGLVFLPRMAREGYALPLPYVYKRGMLARMARQCGAEVLVETGTYMGDTPWALRKQFRRIWTVEVHPPLARLARDRFRRHPHVTVVEADSAFALKDIVPQIDAPALYWLDGHYSFGITGQGTQVCPLFDELETVFAHTKVPFAVMIDDARLFGQEDGYPTLQALADFLARLPTPPLAWLENDIIFLLPRDHPLAATLAALPFPSLRSAFY